MAAIEMNGLLKDHEIVPQLGNLSEVTLSSAETQREFTEEFAGPAVVIGITVTHTMCMLSSANCPFPDFSLGRKASDPHKAAFLDGRIPGRTE